VPQAEILRIIDVVGQSEAEPERAPEERVERAPRDGITTLMIPTADNLAVALRNPKPTIALEHAECPPVPDPRLVMITEPTSESARRYRALRHRLLASPDSRVIAVTSARPAEGKTTCAVNLGLALAEDTMMRVLIVDANLPRPALGTVFGFTPTESLVDRVARLMDLSPPYPVTSIGGTRVHVAALPKSSADRRLERSLFSAALYELRNAYDYIVVDSASVLESADTDVVGECVDAVILVARAGASRKSDLRRAAEQLAPAPILGTVVIDV